MKQACVRLTREQKQRLYTIADVRWALDFIFGAAHVDHIKPLAKGGAHAPENLQVTPARYNLEKSAKLNFPSYAEWYAEQKDKSDLPSPEDLARVEAASRAALALETSA